MSGSHLFHREIGLCVGGAFPNHIIKHVDCCWQERGQRIPLCNSETRGEETKYCNVDLLIVEDNQVRVIIEIEDSVISPTNICGKFLTSALSTFYIPKSENGPSIPMAQSVLFIQVVSALALKGSRVKAEKLANIEDSIRGLLPLKNSKVSGYRLMIMDNPPSSVNCSELVECIHGALHSS